MFLSLLVTRRVSALFEGKVAVVAGGEHGIGRAHCLRIAPRGGTRWRAILGGRASGAAPARSRARAGPCRPSRPTSLSLCCSLRWHLARQRDLAALAGRLQ